MAWHHIGSIKIRIKAGERAGYCLKQYQHAAQHGHAGDRASAIRCVSGYCPTPDAYRWAAENHGFD
jgi:hypothetical protein